MAEPTESVSPAPKTRPAFSAQWGWLSWVLVGIVLVASLIIGVVDQGEDLSPAERSAAIARTIRCPQCRGQSVAESNVTVARQIRADIAKRVDEGQTDAQIQQAYVDIFDDDSILLTPAASGFSSLVWIVPVVAGAVAALALGFAFYRWRGAHGVISGEDERAAADRRLVEQARSKQSDA